VPHELDLIGGNAGAIPALLSLSQIPVWRSCRAVAVALGEELCQTATCQGNAWVWNAEKAYGVSVGTIPLTGFAHGAAGIGLALLELNAATGRTDFLEAGRAAFAYEDSLFNAEQGNWPDLRSYGATAASPPSPQYAVAWCHGAPGIALARLRAISLDPLRRDVHAAVANVALATTRRAVEQTRQHARYDTTLCHGLGGLLEVLWIAAQFLDSDENRAYVCSVVYELIQKHALAGDWPSGLPSAGPNPSLMLGTAGIGYQLLRFHDPQLVAPILIVEAVGNPLSHSQNAPKTTRL
jgi:lantibiotic modifying enzyme